MAACQPVVQVCCTAHWQIAYFEAGVTLFPEGVVQGACSWCRSYLIWYMLSAQLYLSERKCCTKKRLHKHSFVVEGQDGKGEETVSKHSCAWIHNTMTKRYSGSGRKIKNISFLIHYYYYYYYYCLLELSFHSVAVVLTLVQTKQIRINIHNRKNTKKTQFKR